MRSAMTMRRPGLTTMRSPTTGLAPGQRTADRVPARPDAGRGLGNAYLSTCAGPEEETVSTCVGGGGTGAGVAGLETCSGGCSGCAGKKAQQTSLTPEEDGGDGEFATTTAQLDTQALDTQALDGGPPAAPVGNHCSPTSSRFTSIPSGRLTPTFSSSKFGAPFRMTAEFTTPVPCSCVSGEYRQFVRGWAKHNGTAVVHPLCGSNMSATTWQEDCKRSGGRDLKYGYHSIPFGTSTFSNPDQATGCDFNGFDYPGFPLGSLATGDRLELHLEFQGKLVDASDRDRVLRTSDWSVEGSGVVP
jgi:hypothetical protein